MPVSIHAPARGATLATTLAIIPRGCFNPRARTGRDIVIEEQVSWIDGFNPRARTGRDVPTLLYPLVMEGFQSTRPHGARHTLSLLSRVIMMFQSTRPHGARPISSPSIDETTARFNPRARTGRDYTTGDGMYYVYRVSIHAPARGATLKNNIVKPIT